MVGRHARCAHTAERQFLIGNVHDGIVDAGASRGGALQHAADVLLALAEIVQSQRFLSVHYEMDGFVCAREGHDREDRTEDFLLHNRAIYIHMVNDSR